VILLSAGCSRNSVSANAGPPAMPPVAVRAVRAQAADVPLTASAIGNVEAYSSVDVKARVTAPILRVAFEEGQNVNKGELLFELDPESYRRQIAELQADVAKDVASERQAAATIDKDKAAQTNYDSVAQRSTALLKQGILSREQTDQAVMNAQGARASIDADQAALQSAKASEDADKARLAETQLSLSYCRVYAPISGRAGAVQVKAGNVVKENDTTLVSLLQVTPIYVTFTVPENLLPLVRKYNSERPLQVSTLTAGGISVTGTLRFIDNTVDSTTGTIKLKAEFPNTERALWPGQFVNVNTQLDLERGRVLVPARSIQNGPQGQYVWVMNPADQSAAMRTVQVLRDYTAPGQGSQEQAVLGNGVNAGEMVISEGQMQLAPGAHVRLLSGSAT
jgi:multidrug efflux system membrane fusion protein